ncbi:MAG: YgeY family selenium metabolism-linked hydrolase [Spirochaetales bacterium]|uniref:YgeY family selenium metabolism-linked hydrolase n=1 Tax=Candidatus Thalassospirochaeta sargassi TaxID=3119039 RepID=A0AAJ1IJ36_9SPIO|nr:YgeY family selenium metabolism-linked hydrolase [Spirochaetales bacterium]
MNINYDKIRQLSEDYRSHTAETLSALVKIPSFSGEEKNVIHKLKQLCEEAGFDRVEIDGLGNLVAEIGRGSKILAFDAHIDTVTVGDPAQWNTDPFSGIITDEHVLGRGSTDQKGGAASMITAGRILKELGYDGEFKILLTFTIMEEDCDGMCWKYMIEEENIIPDFFVSTEPSSCNIYRGHRGRMEMKVKFRGISCHGSAPERGDNAAYKAARGAAAMEKLNDELPPDDENFLGKGTIVVSQMSAAGPSQCAVPDTAELYLDRRLTWGETEEFAVNQVKDAIPESEDVTVPYYDKISWKGTKYGQDLYFPTWKIDADHPLVTSGVTAYQKLYGSRVKVDKWTFSTNAVAVCGRYSIPTIGFGPGDENEAHAPNEKNRISDLVTCSAFYAALVYSLEGSI